jgi:putative SOS response-associated peptidase YedK
MPVILPKEKYDLWLDPEFKDVKELARLLVPFDGASMRCFPVSTRVNAVSNDDPGCVVPSTHRQLSVRFSVNSQKEETCACAYAAL